MPLVRTNTETRAVTNMLCDTGQVHFSSGPYFPLLIKGEGRVRSVFATTLCPQIITDVPRNASTVKSKTEHWGCGETGVVFSISLCMTTLKTAAIF